MKKRTTCLLAFLMTGLGVYAQKPGKNHANPDKHKNSLYASCKPYTRWWWFASVIKNEDVEDQLNWLKKNNFGGVEIAFIYPVKRNPKAVRFPWLGKDWQDAVRHAKSYADSIGLGCDFTFGTLWPFGGTFVSDADRTQVWGKPDFKQPLRLSWTHLNHLDRHAFFFANPLTEKLAYPVVYGQSYQDSTIIREVTLNFNGKSYPVKLEFKPYQSLFLRINENGGARFRDIYFMPEVPVKE